mmetsp:Transcript_22192/g.32225  ORF Transcript_22192/g.32225 Transcript_22192/m.32225 type:complete len:246 (+) Transcript_22192:16-753(+)
MATSLLQFTYPYFLLHIILLTFNGQVEVQGCGNSCVSENCVMLVTTERTDDALNIFWGEEQSAEFGHLNCKYYQNVDFEEFPELSNSNFLTIEAKGVDTWAGFVFIGTDCVQVIQEGFDGEFSHDCYEFRLSKNASDLNAYESCDIRKGSEGATWYVGSCISHRFGYVKVDVSKSHHPHLSWPIDAGLESFQTQHVIIGVFIVAVFIIIVAAVYVKTRRVDHYPLRTSVEIRALTKRSFPMATFP